MSCLWSGRSGPESIVVFGAVVSTVKLRLAGVGSGLPAASTARTSKVWAPSLSAEVVWVSPGPEQAAKASASTRHSKLAPASPEEKPKVGVVSVVRPLGPESIVVFGGVVSTVKLRLAGVGSGLPAASTARTSKVWAPSASAAVVWVPEPEQAAKASPSTRHSKLAPASSEEKLKVGVLSVVRPPGPESIVVFGGRRVDGEVAAGRGRVGIAGGVDGPDLEGVGAVGERGGGVGAGARAGREGVGVDPAFEARPGVVGGEGEGRRVVVGQAAGAGVDRGRRRGRVDGEAAAGRGRVGIGAGVDGPDLEGVGTVAERGGGVRAGVRAGCERVGVDPAFKGRFGVVGGEGEGRRVVCGQAAGAGLDRRIEILGGICKGAGSRAAGKASRRPAALPRRNVDVSP